MLRLVVFLSLLALSLACKPSSSSSSSGSATTTASTTASTSASASGRKREVGQAHVLVQTNLKFNPALNSILERAFKQGVEQHAHRHGVHYDHNLVYGKTERVGHKFAMGYRILGADCDELDLYLIRITSLRSDYFVMTVALDWEEYFPSCASALAFAFLNLLSTLEKFISTGKRQTDLIGTVFAMCNGKLMVL